MPILRLPSLIGLSLLLLLVLAACGTSYTTTTTTASGGGTTSAPASNKPATTPTKTSGDNEASEYSTPAVSNASTNANAASAATVKTATAMVKGKSETILTNAKGLTLYYFTPDSSTTTACTGGCASTWPPLLISGSDKPASATTLPGKLTALANSNGTQVQYNNHFLYTFAGDSASGQTNGEGILGKWFVATTDLAAA